MNKTKRLIGEKAKAEAINAWLDESEDAFRASAISFIRAMALPCRAVKETFSTAATRL